MMMRAWDPIPGREQGRFMIFRNLVRKTGARLACAIGAAAAACLAGEGNRLAAGEDHLIFLREDGSLWGVGSDQFGQLGMIGPARPLPAAIDQESWSRVSAGAQYSMAIKADGSLWAFGKNGSAQLGLEKCDSIAAPRAVEGDRWLDVAAGSAVTLGIKADGSLIMWGEWKALVTTAGLKGGRKGRPRQVGPGEWSAVAMGANHALALRSDGTLWGMGSNSLGQTGCSSSVPSRTLCAVGDAKWKSITAGDGFSVGIRLDGTLWSWGDNALGELGRGAASEWESMGQVGADKWRAVSAGSHHVIALREDGSLWAWGAGAEGALGIGSLENQPGPVMVGYDKWTEIAAGKGYSAAVRADGEALIWGNLGFMRAQAEGRDPIASRPCYLERKLTLNPIGPVIFGGGDPILGYVANHWDSVFISSGNPSLLQPVAGGIHALAAGRGNVMVRAIPPPGSGQDTLCLIRAVTVAKGRQTLEFPEPEPLAPGTAMEAGAVSSIGLPVTLVSLDPKVVRVAGQRLEAVGPGIAEIRAVQPGDANTLPALSVSRKITVVPKAGAEISAR